MSRYRADDYCELDDPRPVRSTIITATDEIEAAKRTSLNMRDDDQQVE